MPEGWAWVRLGVLCDYGVCKNVDYSEITDNAWILDLEDIEKDTAKLLQRVKKADRNTTSTRHSFKKGDVLYSKLRTYLNKVIVADIDGFCTSEILPLDFKGFIIPEYARHVLMSKMFLDYTTQCGYGVKMPRLGTDDGKKALFPLPPFTEQQRIVSVIEKAFALIDEIESNKLSLEQFIKQAKSKVLDLAIRGKLVPQDPNDEPSSVLLEKIKIEQKTKKTTADIFPYPFEIPKNWQWCKFSDLYMLLSGRDLENIEFNSNRNGIPYLIGASSINNGKFEVNRWTNTPKVVSIRNDLLITCKGTVGELIINNIDQVHIARQFMAVRTIANVDTQYTKYCFYFFINSIKENVKGIIPGISRNDILDLLIPLPPLFEQQRIVQKIETVFKELDILQDNLC